MRIEHFSVECFERFEHLTLRWSPGLNVLSGADPEELQALSHLLSWVLYGSRHPGRDRFLGHGLAGSTGLATVESRGSRISIRRRADETGEGQCLLNWVAPHNVQTPAPPQSPHWLAESNLVETIPALVPNDAPDFGLKSVLHVADSWRPYRAALPFPSEPRNPVRPRADHRRDLDRIDADLTLARATLAEMEGRRGTLGTHLPSWGPAGTVEHDRPSDPLHRVAALLRQSEVVLRHWINDLIWRRDELCKEMDWGARHERILVRQGDIVTEWSPDVPHAERDLIYDEYLDDYGRIVPGRLRAIPRMHGRSADVATSFWSRASAVTRRISSGRVLGLVVRGWQDIYLERAGGELTPWDQASESEQFESVLGLRLALVSDLQAQGVQLPLILADPSRPVLAAIAEPLAAELEQLVRQGQQVLVLTAQQSLAHALAVRGAHTVELVPRAEAVRPFVPMTPDVQVERVRFRPQAKVPAVTEAINSSVPRRSLLASAGVVPREVADRLSARNIRTVGHFLAEPAEVLVQDLAAWGVDTRQIRTWQQILRLSCAIAEITVLDARYLVEAGISEISELAHADEIQLYRDLQRLAAGMGNRAAQDRFDKERVEGFVRAARAIVPWHTDAQPSRRSVRSVTHSRGPRPVRPLRKGSSRPIAASTETPLRRRRPRPARPGVDSVRRVPIRRSHAPDPATWRFYLNPNDPIVHAPAIGPRMAESLRVAGIMTIANLLAADPQQLAMSLANRRVTSQTVMDWQAQTRLACSVPELRGPDARILVACGVRDVTHLASLSAEDLWNRVRPFTRTRDFRKILKGRPSPDAGDVAHWSACARHARSLQAA